MPPGGHFKSLGEQLCILQDELHSHTGTQVCAHSLGWSFNQNSHNLNKYVNV